MYTSRTEYRLSLRHDNADRRLTPLGRSVGLVDDARWQRFSTKAELIEQTARLLENTRCGEATLAKVLRRPEASWADVTAVCPELENVPPEVAEQLVCDAKYAGYLARQDGEIARLQRLAAQKIPADFDYSTVSHLRAEARERLSQVRPIDLAQASRISGITPTDIALLAMRLCR